MSDSPSPGHSVSRSAHLAATNEKAALRSFAPEDLEEMYRLDQICFEPGIAYSRGELRRFLGIPSAVGVVAESSGRIAGFAVGYLAGKRVAHVVTIDVHPSNRRQGLGKALLEELLSRLARAGAREARLEVSVANAGAIAFYERLGFRRGRRLSDYYGLGLDASGMTLKFQVPDSRFQGK